jgi:hypothetical protein
MSNIGNYSPYNKSFKFICFQNKAYHEANKATMRPVVRTNLRRRVSCNPEARLVSNASYIKSSQDGSDCEGSPMNRSNLSVGRPQLSMSQLSVKSEIHSPSRVIHKNASFEKFEKFRINHENKKLVRRLIETNCQVITNKKTNNDFQRHLKYKDIRRLYDSKHVRKQDLVVPKKELLCPTLATFHQRTSSGAPSNQASVSGVYSSYSELLNSRPTTTRTSASKYIGERQ